jgi:fructose-bisphosphate aldolase class II
MALIPLRPLLDHAAANGYGVCALNVNDMEQIQACLLYTSDAADDM